MPVNQFIVLDEFQKIKNVDNTNKNVIHSKIKNIFIQDWSSWSADNIFVLKLIVIKKTITPKKRIKSAKNNTPSSTPVKLWYPKFKW